MKESTKKEFDMVCKGWGTDVIPKENWIDPEKTYKTRSGKEVIGLQIVLKNSCDKEVTYPVKGTIILKKKPLRTTYQIWSLDGKIDVVWDKENDFDLIEVTK